MAMSDYLEDNIIKHLFRTGSFTKPTVLAIALCTVAPVDADTGDLTTGGKEVTGGSYARQTLNPLDANWAATSAGNGLTSNSAQITFPEATANWGTITHYAIIDNATVGAGNLLFHGAVTTSRVINNGEQLIVKVNNLTVTFD